MEFSCEKLFGLDRISEVIRASGFKRVVVQFPDEHLSFSLPVYDYLIDKLNPDELAEGQEDEYIDLFVTADSTFGSSIDDISAEHVDGDLLVYFGSDLSSSGKMPVIVAPMKRIVNVNDCCAQLSQQISSTEAGTGDNEITKVAVLFEPGCQDDIPAIVSQIQENVGNKFEVAQAALPPIADLANWSVPIPKDAEKVDERITVGGLLVPNEITSNTDSLICYVGNKEEQWNSICLQLGHHVVTSYNCETKELVSIRGEQNKLFMGRFGGVSKVKDAEIVGIIIGSMGLTGESTKEILNRVSKLIEAAGKKSYTFIMGRLNEAKLCNFPEVDIFCFISNEDTSFIPPKSFHVPVVTPWELEIGLGAREWTSSYMSNPQAILDDRNCGEGAASNDLDSVIHRVMRKAREDDPYYDSNEESEEDVESKAPSNSEALTKRNNEDRLIHFESAAGDFFSKRDYQGMDAETPQDASTEIMKGRTGIAASYEER